MNRRNPKRARDGSFKIPQPEPARPVDRETFLKFVESKSPVWEYLDQVPDLVSYHEVFPAHEREVADSYARRFQLLSVIVQNTGPNGQVTQTDEGITIQGIEKSRSYFELFGPSIRSVVINYSGFREQELPDLHEIVFGNTLPHLSAVAFEDMPERALTLLEQRVFPNVSRVAFGTSDVRGQMQRITHLFAGLEDLEFNDVNISDQDFAQIAVPNLTNFALFEFDSILRLQNILSCCRNSPNLRELEVVGDQIAAVGMDSLLNLIRNNRMLTKLLIKVQPWNGEVTRESILRLAEQHRVLDTVEVPNTYTLPMNNAATLFDSLQRIQTLTFSPLENNMDGEIYIDTLQRAINKRVEVTVNDDDNEITIESMD